ncbi:hypothetical protein KXQ82_12030 [Mucilaginibacter sp. HMF5004]|uniref:hypothetical protein n=1 Tax=Mucilaginibacter rivuli TaxID=2857527 RepID=UPI001C5E9A2A|nr:hypothetical protein [Mucilaginibacter rivuli]MBW4890454.1 hypothetical protein [Mucilaginibacter rivuli]
MSNISISLHSKVHQWMDSIGFNLNFSERLKNKDVTINHYFFKTFNFIEQFNHDSRSEFVCFDNYGEKIKVRSLLDLQSAFFENLSQLK